MKYSNILFFIVLITQAACGIPHKELLYLDDLEKKDITNNISNQADLRLQPDDLLSITVSSYNLDASKPFNAEVANLQSMAQAMQGEQNVAEMLTGYFVDQEGNIDLPIIGRVAVAGKTLTEVKTHLTEKAKTFLKDPVVNVRFLNLKISIIGEVTRPGTLRLTNKRLTVFEAISLAGDMTPYADRTDVVLIREKDGKRTVGHLNFQSSAILASPFYYLQQNDVLYIRPTKNKVNTVADPTNRVVPYISAGASVLAFLVALLAFTNK